MNAKETTDTRLRRLRMRSWRRGMREMDLILGPFADDALAGLEGDLLDDYEILLDQDDQALYRWVSALVSGAPQDDMPRQHAPILRRIAAFAERR